MAIEPIYWDSDAFLGWLQAEPGKVELCEGTIERAKSGDVLIVTSTLTIAEVLWMRNAPQVPQQKGELLRKFFRRSFIRVRNVTRQISESAQDLVWVNGIRPKDAIHVATAVEARIGVLETFDAQLIGKSGIVGGLLIRKPIPPAQKKLI